MPPPTTTHPTLTLSGAHIALTACETHALHLGIPMNIAIVDSHCHLLAFSRMDGAKITSISIAMDKAFTAAGHRVPTSAYKENVWSGGVAFGIGNSNGGRFCTIGGGVPILDGEGRVLGAVGCSTGTPGEDEEVAIRGRDAVLGMLEGGKEMKGDKGKKRARREVEVVNDVAEKVFLEKGSVVEPVGA